VIWARVTYSVVPNENGAPKYLIGMIEDIDEQKRSSEKLAAQEAEYLRTLEQHAVIRVEYGGLRVLDLARLRSATFVA
jgi:hypothetical protein